MDSADEFSQARKKRLAFRGPSAPLTCLATAVTVSSSSPSIRATLYAGCWDKSIYAWETSSSEALGSFRGGHTDFVKCIVTLKINTTEDVPKDLMISSGAEGAIVIWDILTKAKLKVLKGGHSRGILYLAIDPDPPANDEIGVHGDGGPYNAIIFSAGSDREIRRWAVSPPSRAKEIHSDNPIICHETSVNHLCFDADSDLWTASADGTVKNLIRERTWASDMEINHGSNVRCVAIDEVGGQIITAGRDEDIKIWDRGSGKLRHTYVGHFHEITGLVILGGQLLVSVSLDGTIRTWSLKAADTAVVPAKSDHVGDAQERGTNGQLGKRSLMTEDEERELEELMGDSD